MRKMNRRKKRRAYEPWEAVTLGALLDRQQFNQFVHQAYERLLAFAYQLLRDWDDASDVVQTVLLELWELLTKRVRQPNASALAIIYQQIKRRALDIQRKRQQTFSKEFRDSFPESESFDERSDLSSQDENMPDVGGIVTALEKRDAIYKCGSKLSGRAHEVFFLLMQGDSQADIAKKLGISKPRVSQLMDIIHAQLKQKLQDMGWECDETLGVPLNF